MSAKARGTTESKTRGEQIALAIYETVILFYRNTVFIFRKRYLIQCNIYIYKIQINYNKNKSYTMQL